jgi:hypothetical protein
VTALCGGGTSGPLPGTTLAVDFTTAAISVALSEYGAGWALKAIPFVSSLPNFVLSTFCASDPPAIPTFTQAESDALLQLTFDADFFSALPKMVDLISHVMWYQVCYCTSGSQTALPPAAAPPTGTAIPTNAPLPLSAGCQNEHNANGTVGPFVAAVGTYHSGDLSSPLGYVWTPTQQATSWAIHLVNKSLSGAGLTLTFRYWQDTVYSTSHAGIDVVLAPDTTQDIIVTGLAGNTYLLVGITANTGTGTASVNGTSISAYCGGATPGGVQTPCCPTDPTTQFTLDAILAMATLIQRQLAPFAYVQSTAHAGLSGNNQFAVQGLLGLAVTLTTIPARAGSVLGNPNELYGVGWVNVGTADGWGPREWISSSPFLIRPVAPDVTLVGYSIPSDVVATITELKREA